MIDKLIWHKVICRLLFYLFLQMSFLLNRLIQKIKTLGCILGNSFAEISFHPLPFPPFAFIQIATGILRFL